MKTFWLAQQRRIDGLSLRERVIMFISLCVAMVALVDVLAFSPAMAERRTIARQLLEQTQQIDALRAQLSTGAADDSPRGRLQAALATARTDLAAADVELRQRLAGHGEIAGLREVLDRLLRRHERLTLIRLATADDVPATPDSRLRWQGVDLTVTGTYADLVDYVDELGRAMPGLRWGELQIKAPSQPPVLAVRLLLPGESP